MRMVFVCAEGQILEIVFTCHRRQREEERQATFTEIADRYCIRRFTTEGRQTIKGRESVFTAAQHLAV